MPRVQTYRTNPTFQAQAQPNPGRVAPNQLGQKVVAAAQQIGGAVINRLHEDDETNLLSFSNTLQQSKAQLLNDPDSGFLTQQGINAQNARDSVQQQWQQQSQQALDGLPDRLKPRAQAMLGKYTVDFDDDVGRHVRTQTDVYKTQVYKDTLNSTANEAALHYDDADRVQQQAESAAIATRLDRRRQGLPEDGAANAAASNVYQAAIERQAGNDPLGAERRYYELLEQGKLTGESAARIDTILKPIAQDAASTADAAAIMAGQPVDAGAAPDSIDDAIIGAESGGNATAKNPASTATGAGQFTEGTWLDQIRKNRPDLVAGKSDAEILAMRTDPKLSREMVGAYREENSRRLRAAGVPATASNIYAAHHFGPSGAIAFANADASTPMSAILDKQSMAANGYLQGKTKADVLKIWQARGIGGGQDSIASGAPPASEAEALERAQQIADPRRREAVMGKLRLQWSIRDSQERAADKAVSERTYQALEGNTNPGASLAQLVSPSDYANLVRTGKAQTFENYRKNVLEGRLIQDNPVLADALFRQSALQPTEFQKTDLHAYADQLSAGTLTTLVNRQNELTKSGATAQKDWMSEEDRLNYGYTMLGIGKEGDAGGAGSETKNAPRNKLRGEFRIALQDATTAFMQTSGGKKPTPEQADVLLRATAKQFSQNLQAGRLSATQDDKGVFKPNKDRPLGMYGSAARYQQNISQADRDAVSNAYQEKYGHRPTNAWLTQYFAAKQGGAK